MRTLTIRRSLAPLVLAAALLASFIVLFAWPQSAAAHDSLIDSDPAADSTVETLPDELTLTFSNALIGGDGSTAVVITDAEGTSITDGTPRVDGAMVIQPLVADAAAGEYTVLWQVISSDGHPTDGEFSFILSSSGEATDAPDAVTTPEPDATESDAAVAPTATETPSESTPESSFLRVLPWIIGGVIVAAGGGALIAVLTRRKRDGDTAAGTDSDTHPER
ncbi:MAG: copper resistance CopC family protein [Microbacterium sp.]|uniref:copper resistance CopC family protein n=1 Tax=Microbacterium sp. TaxID=51671 RepID=UPI003F980ADF